MNRKKIWILILCLIALACGLSVYAFRRANSAGTEQVQPSDSVTSDAPEAVPSVSDEKEQGAEPKNQGETSVGSDTGTGQQEEEIPVLPLESGEDDPVSAGSQEGSTSAAGGASVSSGQPESGEKQSTAAPSAASNPAVTGNPASSTEPAREGGPAEGGENEMDMYADF